jgi:hypothetical protein
VHSHEGYASIAARNRPSQPQNFADSEQPRDREWWRQEAIRTRTDWSSLLRQRIRVKAWIKAGRPPLAKWMAEMSEDRT